MRLSSSDVPANEREREEILRRCLDIDAACVTQYDRDRFKTCIFEKCLSATPLKTFADFPSSHSSSV